MSLVDATTVKEAGKTGGQWRIHYSLRLPTLECDHFDLTPARGKNAGERLGRFVFHAGEVVLADAGYSHPPGIAAVVRQGADVCLRVNPSSLPLWDEQGRPFPLLRKLNTLKQAGKKFGRHTRRRWGEPSPSRIPPPPPTTQNPHHPHTPRPHPHPHPP